MNTWKNCQSPAGMGFVAPRCERLYCPGRCEQSSRERERCQFGKLHVGECFHISWDAAGVMFRKISACRAERVSDGAPRMFSTGDEVSAGCMVHFWEVGIGESFFRWADRKARRYPYRKTYAHYADADGTLVEFDPNEEVTQL